MGDWVREAEIDFGDGSFNKGTVTLHIFPGEGNECENAPDVYFKNVLPFHPGIYNWFKFVGGTNVPPNMLNCICIGPSYETEDVACGLCKDGKRPEFWGVSGFTISLAGSPPPWPSPLSPSGNLEIDTGCGCYKMVEKRFSAIAIGSQSIPDLGAGSLAYQWQFDVLGERPDEWNRQPTCGVGEGQAGMTWLGWAASTHFCEAKLINNESVYGVTCNVFYREGGFTTAMGPEGPYVTSYTSDVFAAPYGYFPKPDDLPIDCTQPILLSLQTPSNVFSTGCGGGVIMPDTITIYPMA